MRSRRADVYANEAGTEVAVMSLNDLTALNRVQPLLAIKLWKSICVLTYKHLALVPPAPSRAHTVLKARVRVSRARVPPPDG